MHLSKEWWKRHWIEIAGLGIALLAFLYLVFKGRGRAVAPAAVMSPASTGGTTGSGSTSSPAPVDLTPVSDALKSLSEQDAALTQAFAQAQTQNSSNQQALGQELAQIATAIAQSAQQEQAGMQSIVQLVAQDQQSTQAALAALQSADAQNLATLQSQTQAEINAILAAVKTGTGNGGNGTGGASVSGSGSPAPAPSSPASASGAPLSPTLPNIVLPPPPPPAVVPAAPSTGGYNWQDAWNALQQQGSSAVLQAQQAASVMVPSSLPPDAVYTDPTMPVYTLTLPPVELSPGPGPVASPNNQGGAALPL